MSITEIADIPADLAEEAARELVEQAKAEAEKLKAEGITREQVMESFEKNYFDILKQL